MDNSTFFGLQGEDLELLQQFLHIHTTGAWDAETHEAVRLLLYRARGWSVTESVIPENWMLVDS